MKVECSPMGYEPPVIDPGVEKRTAQLFHQLNRVVVEVRAPGGSGYRKLNAIDLGGWPPQTRTSEQEDELNAAIMQVAMGHVEESGESKQFRARYMAGFDENGKEVRKYACFKVQGSEDEVTLRSPFAAMPSMPSMPSMPPWLEALIPVGRWIVSMLESRELQLMAYNEKLSDKLLEASAQAEPLLRAHGQMSRVLEQGIQMLMDSVLMARENAIQGAQLLRAPGGDPGGGDGDSDGLVQTVVAALMQFFSGGKMPLPSGPMGPMGPGGAPPSPSPVRPPSTAAASSGSGRGPERSSASVEAKPPGGVGMVLAVRRLFGGWDGMQLLELMSKLDGAQCQALCTVRAAKTEEAVAQAIVALQAGGGWQVLCEQVDEASRALMARLGAQARTHGAAPEKPPVEHALVKLVRRWLGSLDGEQGMALVEQLGAEERERLAAVRAAQTDDAIAKAMLDFKAAVMVDETKVAALKALLDEADTEMLRLIDVMAQRQVMDGDDYEGMPPSPAPRDAETSASPNSTTVEAVLCSTGEEPEAPEGGGGRLLSMVQDWLRQLSEKQRTALHERLTPEQRACLVALDVAGTDDEAARAVLALEGALLRGANWGALASLLGQHAGVLVNIQAMAQQFMGSRSAGQVPTS